MWENTIRSKIGDIIQLTDGLKLKIDKKKKRLSSYMFNVQI